MKPVLIFCVLCMAAFLSVTPVSCFAETGAIAAVVNDDAVSRSDVARRMKLVLASSGLPDTVDIRGKLRPQIVSSLIDEMVMKQEGEKQDLSVEQAEIDRGFAALAQQNNMKPEQFEAMLRHAGIDPATLYSQIGAQIVWSKVVQTKLRPQVRISDRDVDDVIARMKRSVGKAEYLVAEIFLPTGDGGNIPRIRQLADRLVAEIRSGKASFFKLAQQFSKSPGAAGGGDLGWLAQDQIDPEILAALQSTGKNQVTAPVKTPDGFHILFLRDKRDITEDTLPSRDQLFYTLGTQRLDMLQRGYLRDLRAASFIEIRD